MMQGSTKSVYSSDIYNIDTYQLFIKDQLDLMHLVWAKVNNLLEQERYDLYNVPRVVRPSAISCAISLHCLGDVVVATGPL